jgi:hypothetical protein
MKLVGGKWDENGWRRMGGMKKVGGEQDEDGLRRTG